MNSFALVDHLGWVLIHSLWQFGAIALLAGLVVWMLRQSSSSARYGVWVIALAVSVAAPVVTWMVLPIEMPAVIAVDPPAGDEVVIPALIEPIVAAPPLSQDITVAGDLPSANLELRDPILIAAVPPVEAVLPPTWSERITELLRPWMTWIVAGWCVGVMLCALRPLLGWHTLWRLRTVGVAPVSDDIRAAMRRVSDRLRLRQTVQVLQSTLSQVPVVVGYLRPVILLPVSLLANMPPSQLEAILAHELAHIRRHDFVVNLLQTLVETLFFYHPAVWWLSRQIRIEREHCCDDLVVAALGNRAEYGRALLAIEELRGERTLLALGAHDGSLLSRIRRIVGFRADRTASSPWLGILVVTGLFGVIVSVGVSGWTASTEKDPDTAVETVEDDKSNIEKTLEPPQPAIAEWTDGRSIEFVGITQNTAPAKDGWLPSGLPIGDVGYWKSTTVLHGGNTMATYVENGPHPEPDAEAIDFLFRFRGLKAQPSLTFDLPAHGTGYSHWPVTDPYELRVSTRKRGPQPPGGQWVPPDGVVRVGVTDEPWGRWVKVSPEGKVLDPIQPEERYAATYKLIEVVGTKKNERISTGVAILFRQPAGNKDPDNPDHQYAWEYRAIDNEGKEHWALQWASSNIESQYGLAQPLPAGKTLSHYEYRLRPYRHWATFANVSLQPGPQTEVKVTAQTAATTPAVKLANHFAAALRAQKLPFLDDAKIAYLAGELLDTLRQRPPSRVSEEQLQKLQNEYRGRATEIDAADDVLERLKYYYAGLRLPEMTPEKWKTLSEGVSQFVKWEFDPREKDAVYLQFRNRFETLRSYVAAFLARPELPPAQADRRQDQRAWMKQEIFKLPESPKFRLTHGAEIDKLQKLLDDPLDPFFSTPLDEAEFAKLKKLFAEKMSGGTSETRLNQATLFLRAAIVDLRASAFEDAMPFRTYGWQRSNTRWMLNTTPQIGNSSLHLEDRHQRPESSYVDIPTMRFVDGTVPPKLEDHAEWLHKQAKGDLAYDAKADAFIAVRGARLAVLNATSWYAADLVPMPELKRLLLQGVESVPMSTFVKPSTFGDNQIRDLRDDAPSLVLQTNEGRIAVIRLFTFGPVIQSHLRPLPPNPPLHPGDLPPPQVRVLDAAGNPATFNAMITAQVGYTKKPKLHWLEWRDKAGLVSLEMLPHGKHWIIAAPEFEQRTIFPITYPMDEKLIEWRLRESESWTQRDFDFKPRFEPNAKTGGDIVVAIKNKFDKPLTLSEADFCLHVGETATYRAMSPQWVDGKFQTIEIPAKESGEIRLNWNDWVRKGFWVSRDAESISEPALPPDEPGRIYVRVNLGNSGALPIAVTDPALILVAQQDEPNPPPAKFPHIVIREGEKLPLTMPLKIRKFHLFNPQVVEVKALRPNVFELTGKMKGLTPLSVVDERGQQQTCAVETIARDAAEDSNSFSVQWFPGFPSRLAVAPVESGKASVSVFAGITRVLEFPWRITDVAGFDQKLVAVRGVHADPTRLNIDGLAPGRTTLTVQSTEKDSDGFPFSSIVEIFVEELTRERLLALFVEEDVRNPPAKDERTSLLESLIQKPTLETFQKLLALADGQHPLVTELLDDSRRHSGEEKMGGEIKVVSNDQEKFAIVSARVIPIMEPADVAVRVDPERRAECAFVFDMQGRLIDTIGGKLALGNSLGGDDIHIVNLGPEEDWFVRVMNFEKRGELNYRSDYYRIANPVVKSFRFYNLPNACSWSNGPEKIPRQGRLHPAHPKAERRYFAGIPKEVPVITAAGVPTVGSIVWDGDRNRWFAAPSAFVKGLPLYEVDTTWSREFESLEPQAGQLTIEGGIREFDHWSAWEAAVPNQGNTVAVLTIPQRDGPAKLIEKKLAPGRHTVQLQVKPDEKGPGVKLKLWIDDDQKYDFDMPFVFGEAFANHPPIVHTLKSDESARLVHRLLKETTAALLFEIKLQPQDLAATVTAISEKDPTPEAERQARAILRDRFHIRVDRTPGSDAAGSLHLFDLPAAAWEFVGQLTGIRQIRVEAGDARGEAMKQVARIKSLESLSVINAKFLPADLKPFAKHPSLQTLDALFTTFDELGHEEGRLRLLGTLSDDERAWIEAATARWPHDPNQLKGYRRVVEGAAITDPALEALTALPKLRTIRLVNTSLSDRGLKALQQLPQLEELHVYLVDGSPATGKLLAGFPKLRHLRETYALGYDILPEVAQSPTLEELSIRFAKDSHVDHIVLCRGVKRLNLSNNSLTDGGLLKLASMPQLERLVLSGNETQITQIGVKKFRESKPNCEIVGTEQLSEKPAPDAASTANVQATRGTLKGRFIYDGEAPKPRDLRPDLSKLEKDAPVPRDPNGRPIGTAMWYLDYLKAGIRPKTEDASLLVDKDGGVANVVVWVSSKDIPWTPKDNYELPAMIYVKDGHFTPRIRLLTTGRPLLVENTDPVAFTFATTFQRNNDVNALLPPAADKKPFRIDKLQSEQLPARFHSTVATWAEGFLFVRDNTYVAVSQPDGTFTMPDLPPGEWEFRAWHERRGYLSHWPKGTFQHTIQPGDNNFGTIKLKPEFFEPREER